MNMFRQNYNENVVETGHNLQNQTILLMPFVIHNAYIKSKID